MKFLRLPIYITVIIFVLPHQLAGEVGPKNTTEVDASKIILALKSGDPVKISNAQIIGTLNFNEAIAGKNKQSINSPLYIRDSVFKGKVLGRVTFTDVLDLSNNSFEAEVDFNSCTFEEAVILNKSEFLSDVVFNLAQFKKGAGLRETKFKNTTNFDSISADGNMDFTGTQFSKDANFAKAELKKGIKFSQVKIDGKADFSYAQLGDTSLGDGQNDFSDTWFSRGVNLSYAQINAQTIFIQCSLKEILDLRSTKINFPGIISWTDTPLGQLILLNSTTDLNPTSLGIGNAKWEFHLNQRIDLVKEKKYDLSHKEAELLSFKVLRESSETNNQVRYLTKVFETEFYSTPYRILRIVFLDWTIGYGYKFWRLLIWIFPFFLFFLIRYYYERKTSIELINREREDRYPTWANRIATEIVGSSRVKLDFVPRRHREYVFNRYHHEYTDPELTYRDDSIYLTNHLIVDQFIKHWAQASNNLTSNNIDEFKKATLELMDIANELLGLKVDQNPKFLHGKLGIMVYAPAIRLNVPAKFPFIFLQSKDFSDEDIKGTLELLKLLDARGQYFAINVVFVGRQKYIQQVQNSIYRSDFVVVDKQSLWQIFSSKFPIKVLTEIILGQVDLLAVSPYVTGGPVSSKMFFGRINEEKTLLQTIDRSNFAIVANRKIGKTSLLYRIRDYLVRDQNFQVYLFDLQPATDYKKFFKNIARTQFSSEFRELIAKLKDIEPLDIYEVVFEIKKRKPNRQMVIIFDEVDDILEYDQKNKYELFKTLRELSQNNICQFIFIGSRMLVKSVQDPYSPFFNFCKIMRLGCLEEKYARELITGPMKEMGIHFDDESLIVGKLIEVSSCHPNILQYICEQLLRQINTKNSRVITIEDSNEILDSREFKEYYTTVLWGQASSYEKLIVYTMMRNGVTSFNENMIRSEFDKLGVTAAHIRDALNTLELYSLTSTENGQFSFAFNYLTEIIKQKDIDSDIEDLMEDIEKT